MAGEIRVQFAQKAVIVDQERLLLVRKSGDDPHSPDRWELPGGRLKAGENLDDSLTREVREEVRLDVLASDPLAVWSWTMPVDGEPTTVVAIARKCTVTSANPKPSVGSAELDDFLDSYAWFDFDEVLAQNLIPSARGPIARCLALLKIAGMA